MRPPGPDIKPARDMLLKRALRHHLYACDDRPRGTPRSGNFDKLCGRVRVPSANDDVGVNTGRR